LGSVLCFNFLHFEWCKDDDGTVAECLWSVGDCVSLLQHPDKDTNTNNQAFSAAHKPRGRDYKRFQDEDVILVLVKAAEDLSLDGTAAAAAAADGQPGGDAADQQQQQQQKQSKDKGVKGPPVRRFAPGGDYDGPDAPDVLVSGIPKLPPNTFAPPSPVAHEQAGGWARQGGGQGGDGPGQQQQQQQQGGGLMQHGSGGMNQQQQHLMLMHRCSSNASAGLAGLVDDADDADMGGSALVPVDNSRQQGEGGGMC
jgi:hypothetical protein